MTRRVQNDAEPGAQVEYEVLATKRDDEHDNTYRFDGETWECGRDYWDSEVSDVAELTDVHLKSGRMSLTEPDVLVFVFDYERAHSDTYGPIEVRVQRELDDPRRPDPSNRFEERYVPPNPKVHR